jgi:hypothetical protein
VNDGVWRLRRQRQDCVARTIQFFECNEEFVARDQALDRRSDILPASPGVKAADICAADRHQVPFDLEVVARSHRAWRIARRIDAIDGIENPGPKRFWNDPPLDDHHRGGLVDLGKPEKTVMGRGMRGIRMANQKDNACGPKEASARQEILPDLLCLPPRRGVGHCGADYESTGAQYNSV